MVLAFPYSIAPRMLPPLTFLFQPC